MKRNVIQTLYAAMAQHREASPEKKALIEAGFEKIICSIHNGLMEGKQKLWCARQPEDKIISINCMNTTSNFAEIDREALRPVFERVYSDRGWALAFDPQDIVEGKFGFDIYRVTKTTKTDDDETGFPEVPEGAEMQFNQRESFKKTIIPKVFADGISLTWQMRKARAIAAFQSQLVNLFDDLAKRYAKTHYDVLLDIGNTNTDFVAFNATATSKVMKVILTLNAGAKYLRDNNKERGIGDPNSVPFIIYCHDDLYDTITAALRINPAALAAGGESEIEFVRGQVEAVPTYYSGFKTLAATKDSVLMVWPKGLIQNQFYMPEAGKSFTWENPKSLDTSFGTWAAYGAGFYDDAIEGYVNKQVVRVQLAT